MCGEIDEQVVIGQEMLDRMRATTRKLDLPEGGAPSATPQGLAEPDGRAAYMEATFREGLARAMADISAAEEDETVDALALRAIALARLAGYYADAIAVGVGRDFDVLFGPAYKGIPLAAGTAMTLSERGHEVGFCFNRKETKDHGEGGSLVGCVPNDGDRVLIIEDVTTAGTSVRETVPLLRSVADVKLAGLVVSVDRMERGQGQLSALDELRHELSMPTFAIVTLDDIITHLESTERGKALATGDLLTRIAEYRASYGAQQT